jgi:hypothetical protein
MDKKEKPVPFYIKNAMTLEAVARILKKTKPKLQKPKLTRWQVNLLKFED